MLSWSSSEILKYCCNYLYFWVSIHGKLTFLKGLYVYGPFHSSQTGLIKSASVEIKVYHRFCTTCALFLCQDCWNLFLRGKCTQGISDEMFFSVMPEFTEQTGKPALLGWVKPYSPKKILFFAGNKSPLRVQLATFGSWLFFNPQTKNFHSYF